MKASSRGKIPNCMFVVGATFSDCYVWMRQWIAVSQKSEQSLFYCLVNFDCTSGGIFTLSTSENSINWYSFLATQMFVCLDLNVCLFFKITCGFWILLPHQQSHDLGRSLWANNRTRHPHHRLSRFYDGLHANSCELDDNDACSCLSLTSPAGSLVRERRRTCA